MAKLEELLDRLIAGASVSDEEVERLAYPIAHYELTLGPNRWDSTNDPERFGRYVDALASLRGRLRALEEARKPAVSQEVIDFVAGIADVEAAAQDADDREDVRRSSRLRSRARDLKDRLAALQVVS